MHANSDVWIRDIQIVVLAAPRNYINHRVLAFSCTYRDIVIARLAEDKADNTITQS